MAATAGPATAYLQHHSQQAMDEEFEDSAWQNWSRSSFSSASDGESFKSATSSFTESAGSPEGSLGNRTFLGKQLLEWKERYEDQKARTVRAEQRASELVSDADNTKDCIASLKEVVAKLQAQNSALQGCIKSVASQHRGAQQSDERDEVYIARLVGRIMSKIVTQDEAEKRWSAEVRLLRQRLERSAIMQSMVQDIKAQEKARQAEEWQRYLHISTVTACCGVAFVGLVLLSRRLR